VESFNDWMPLARAEAERARAQATAFLAAPAQLAPQVCSAAAVAQPAAAKAQRKCSQCRQPGHTKRTCSAAAAAAGPPAPPLTWTYSPSKTYTFPAGEYYVGDLCYPESHSLPAGETSYYDGIFQQHGYEPGLYLRSDGGGFLVGHTAYGDGEYEADDGAKYPVDAGIIGILSTKLFDKEAFLRGYETCPGTIRTWPNGVRFTATRGQFVAAGVGNDYNGFTIDTN
jgi:hypothetical protein